MIDLFSRTEFESALAGVFAGLSGPPPVLPGEIRLRGADPAMAAALSGVNEAVVDKLPPEMEAWLRRLMLLHGVPIHYLVPAEAMLPPESIRFFYLDMNWVDALIDGAFSIGRNLAPTKDTASHALDRVAVPLVRDRLNQAAGSVRAQAFGARLPSVTLHIVSGFLLRSSLVQHYPGIEICAYGGPDDRELTLLRFEQLGPASDTLICLVDGDLDRVEIREPAEQLHYGIDSCEADGKMLKSAKKTIRFTLEGKPAQPKELQPGWLRKARTLDMAELAKAIAVAAGVGKGEVHSGIMGFEMTEGVGRVTFKREVK